MEKETVKSRTFTVSLNELNSKKFYGILLLSRKKKLNMIKNLESEVRRLNKIIEDIEDTRD